MPFSDELTGITGSQDSRPMVIVAMTVLPLSILVALLPQPAPIRWDIAGIAIAIGVLVYASAAYTDHRSRTKGLHTPEPVVLVQLSAMMLAAGLAIYAGNSPLGIFNSLLIVVVTIFAVWGDAKMMIYAAAFAPVVLLIATLALDVPTDITITLVIEYTICWTVTATIAYLLVGSLRVEQAYAEGLEATARSLASVAQAGVRVGDLRAALDASLPLLRDVVPCSLVRAVAVDGSGSAQVIAADPVSEPGSTTADGGSAVAGGGDGDGDGDGELHAALASGVHRVVDSTVYLPVGQFEDRSIVLVLDGHPRPGSEPADDATISAAATIVAGMVDRASFVHVLENLTRTDSLTGLANRLAMMERLQQDVSAASRTGRPACVAMVDLDHFKAFNDLNGHVAGDQVLREVSAVLRSRARSSDLVARYGGEEFCLCLPDTTLAGALAHVEDQRERVAEIAAEQSVTFSAGVACWDGAESILDLIRRADAALYQAKRDGRNRIIVDEGA